jgi:hypothetical protein
LRTWSAANPAKGESDELGLAQKVFPNRRVSSSVSFSLPTSIAPIAKWGRPATLYRFAFTAQRDGQFVAQLFLVPRLVFQKPKACSINQTV